MRGSSTWGWGAVAAVVALALGLADAGDAHFDSSDPYTHGSCPGVAENRVDPINVVFHGWGTWGRAVSQIESHLEGRATSGSGQQFGDHGRCQPQHAQRASGHGSRIHLRIRGQHHDAALGWTATGDAHHEDLVLFPPCGHAVDANGAGGSGFDRGRDELAARFAAAGHATALVWWGNTQSFKHGWTAFIALHQVNHA